MPPRHSPATKKTAEDAAWRALLTTPPLGRCRLPVGEGWRTAHELTKQAGQTKWMVRRRIKAMLKDGKVEKFTGTATSEDKKRLKYTVWYRIK